MTIVFTPSNKTADRKQMYSPHNGSVPQTKKPIKRGAIVPGGIGPDGLRVPPVKKDFWLRDFLQRREQEV